MDHHNMERYRSGHNGAVLKTVRVQAHMGSNPILSAKPSGEVLKWWRGSPAKGVGPWIRGARVQIPPSPPALHNGGIAIHHLSFMDNIFHKYAQIAQSVEQRTENPRVAGSIPALGTIIGAWFRGIVQW